MGSLRTLREEASPERYERSVIRWVSNLGFSLVTRRGGKRTFLRVTKDGDDVLIFLRPKGRFALHYARTRHPEWDKKRRKEGRIDRIEFEKAFQEVIEEGRAEKKGRSNRVFSKG
jgi:anaerobic selenocysteine-containing dehydrogenase